MSAPAMPERLAGGLYGLLVGDAVGVPYEFSPPERIPASGAIDVVPPPDFLRAHPHVPPGTWSDDGAQALCLLASLLDRGRFDVDDFATRLCAWFDQGYLALDGDVFDVGVQTGFALRAVMSGAPPASAGSCEERHNGNGSLMRVLPLALWHRGSDAELVSDAVAQSRVTHGHALSLVSCAVYCLWARVLLEGGSDAWPRAVARLRSLPLPGELGTALERLAPDAPPAGRGSGFVVDTLGSARMVVDRHPAYEDVVRAAIALGDDTDTTACVAGGIAGVRAGAADIPARWLDALRGKDVVQPMLDALVAHRGG